ncbi:hypothetical protein RchiOBHm_Chr5g0074201 [Rosa chinensis]|uniref:Uncharacterized protein n=1 Tax=Rosa chinensis TaxID=74649 RepID=A0A2P6QL49_ROSCH|nr:hypothetical protein RchiOBHm_Chr5g0074201 [Rosa chinensis]
MKCFTPRPLPSSFSVIPLNQILTQLVKLKHYSAVITLNRRMLLCGVVPNHYTLSIIINCYCHLNQMGSWHNSSNWVFNQTSSPSTLSHPRLCSPQSSA